MTVMPSVPTQLGASPVPVTQGTLAMDSVVQVSVGSLFERLVILFLDKEVVLTVVGISLTQI